MAKHTRTSRYSRYSGGPDPLAPPVDLREALEAIGQDVMEGTSPRRALSELLRRGSKNMPGADHTGMMCILLARVSLDQRAPVDAA